MPERVSDDEIRANLEVANDCLRDDPDDKMALLDKGMFLVCLNRVEEGVACIDRVEEIAKDENNSYYLELSYLYRAGSFYWMQQYEDVMAHLKKILKISPNNADAYFYMGCTLHVMQKYEDAIRHFDSGIRLYCIQPEIYYRKACALNECKKYRAAVKCLKEFLLIEPDNADAYSQMGRSYMGLKKFKHAVMCQKKAIKLDPQHFEAHMSLGLIYTITKRYSRAIKYLDIIWDQAREKPKLLPKLAKIRAICDAKIGTPR